MEINYDKKRIVAVLDVMGFKNLLAPSPENLRKLNKYFDYIDGYRIFGFRPGEPFPKLHVDIMAVSDSIVASTIIEPEWDSDRLLIMMTDFFVRLTSLQASLALEGIWIRGAVSIGDLYLDLERSILVGQAFVDAHNLEREANYPRIIIDPRVLKAAKLSAPSFCKKLQSLNTPILAFNPTDTNDFRADDYIQLDWFGPLLDSHREDPPLPENPPKPNIYKDFFDDLIERQHAGSDIFLKTQKLIGYLQRSFVEAYFRNGQRRNPATSFIQGRLSELTGLSPFDLYRP